MHQFCKVDFAKIGMTNNIEHQGIVENIDGMHIAVRIVQTSACSTCVAAGHCNASEMKVKIIDVYTAEFQNYSIGQEVRLYGSSSMGMQAVLWAFGVPFIILVFVLSVLQLGLGLSEVVSALGALASLIPYYVVLYLLRYKMSKKFSFTIKPIK